MNELNRNLDERYLEFYLGGESYAVEILKVREVITPPELTSIPKSPVYVCGLMNLRGLVLTVIDLRKKLSLPIPKEEPESAVIIFDLGDRLVGGRVDSIHRVINVPTDSVKPVPDTDDTQISLNLKGIFQQQDRLTLWLNIEKLIGMTSTPSKIA